MSEIKEFDICVIGAGASGCLAAINAKRQNRMLNLCLIEKGNKILRKVIASGNGRCNIANSSCEGIERLLLFFKTIGIFTVEEEEGRLYPYTKQSSSVVSSIKTTFLGAGIKPILNTAVTDVKRLKNGGFKLITSNDDVYVCKKLLIASGGKAAPAFGTTGDGYIFAKKLGHTIKTLMPVLTAINCEGDFEEMKGCRAEGEVTLYRNGEKIASERGEIQFTAEGISGICVMNLSRLIKLDMSKGLEVAFREYTVKINFNPEMARQQMIWVLKELREFEGIKTEDIYMSLLRKPIAKRVLTDAGIDLNKQPSELTDEELKKISRIYQNWSLQVTGAKGWKYAQCTAGGVSLDEVDPETMESKLVPGLYFSGEVLDYDGPCGGYNLYNAWTTGLAAGKAMGQCIEKRR